MADAFITLWSQKQLEIERRGPQGRLDHSASGQFRARGVGAGDRVYIVATDAGRLLLIARLDVERVVSQREAEAIFRYPVYQAPDHLIGKGTELILDRVVPEDVARRIQRESGKVLKIDPNTYTVDVQSLRATGRITEESALLFDHVLEELIVTRPDPEFREGKRSLRMHLSIERSSRVRAAAIAIQGAQCKICRFSFESAYGALGDGFIEVHHLAPLGRTKAEVKVNPETDVVVVCANCHHMLHRRDPPLTPEQLRRIRAQRARR